MKLILYVFFIGVCLSAFTYAQPSHKKKKSQDTLETKTKEIVVSALRYPELLLEVPLSVSLLKIDDLNDIRGLSIDEPLVKIPGVLAQSRFGGSDVRLTIRGFGARGSGDRSNSGTTRGLRFYIDGIPETEPDGRTSLDLFDMSIMDNVEIIRSNASAIWGNAAGGVLTYSTLPSIDKSSIDAGFLFGSYGLRKFNINAASKLADNGMVKISFVRHVFDGYRQNSSGNRTLFNISMRTDSPYLTLHISGVENSFLIPGPLTQAAFDTLPSSANAKYMTNKEHRDNRILRIGANFLKKIGENQEVSAMAFATPKYLQRSERGTYRDFNRYHLGANISYKNSFTVANVANTLLIGLDEQYQNGSAIFYKLDAAGKRSTTMTANKAEGANNFGSFIQDEIFAGDFSFLVGLRYDNIIYEYNDYLTAQFQSKRFEKLTPKLATSFKFDENHSLFANMGGGIEVPAGNEVDPSPYLGQDTIYLLNPLLEPIKSTTYEIGTKNYEYFYNSFFQSLEYDLSVFYINIFNDIIPYKGGKFYFTAGKSNRMGAEARVSLNVSSGLSFDASLTYLNSKYKTYLVDSVHYNPAKQGKFADYGGNKTSGIPSLNIYGGLSYAPLFMKGFNIAVNIQYVGDYFTDDANKITVPSFFILNGKFAYKLSLPFISSKLNVYAGVNNILDKKYAASAFINPEIEKNTGRPFYLEPGLPRNMYVGITYYFE